MNRLLKLASIPLIVSGAAFARAEPDFLEIILKKYSIADDSVLGQSSCAICHVSDEDYDLNAYGKQIGVHMKETNAKFSLAVLEAIGAKDADGDGDTNDAELTAGNSPSVSSKPGGTPPATSVEPEAPKPLVPKNGYHPAIVHFPIALLIAGLLLDFAGLVKKQPKLLFAGWYNLVLSAVTSFGAIGSGFLAMRMLKLPYKGLIGTHMWGAIGVTVIIWLMVALRVHRHEKMNVGARVAYYALAAAAFLMISWVGHLGGVFVYGE